MKYVEDANSELKLKEILSNKKYLSLIKAAVNLTSDKIVSLSFGGDGSYTNGKHINVGVFAFLLKYTKRDIMFSLISCALHEAQHVVSTDFDSYVELINEYEDDFDKSIIQHLSNSLEDGRIEYIHKKHHINNVKYINKLRFIWREEQKIKKPFEEGEDLEECKAGILDYIDENYEDITDEEKKELMEEMYEDFIKANTSEWIINSLLFSICCLATTGKMPIGYNHLVEHESKVKNFFVEFDSKIKKVVKEEEYDKVRQLTIEIYEYMLEHFNEELEICRKNSCKIKCEILVRDYTISGNPGEDESEFWEGDITELELDKELINEIQDAANQVSANPAVSEVIFNKAAILDVNNKSTKSPFRQEVQNLKNEARKLKEMIFREREENLENGRVNTKQLWKTILGKKDIMYKSEIEFKKDIALYLLVDASGSMAEMVKVKGENMQRMHVANRTAAIIEEAFTKYINLEIAYFDGNHNIVRYFDDDIEKSYVWAKQRRAGGANCDYDNLEIAREKLQKREEQKKIIIIISDGLPCGCRGGKSPEEAVREEVIKAKRANIQTIAIALCSNPEHYKPMYDHIISCDSSSLQRKLVDTIMKIMY